MATNDESLYVDCDTELFETALEDYFTQLSVNGDDDDDDEYEELSRITNSVLTPLTEKSDERSALSSDAAEYDQLRLPPPDCAKDYFQASTPKREKHKFLRPMPKPKLLVRFAEFKQPNEESQSDEICSNSREMSCISELEVSSAAASNSISVHDAEPEILSLSVIIREQRRHQLILSPFSQHLKDAISRQDSIRKRQQHLVISKKAQRASLRV